MNQAKIEFAEHDDLFLLRFIGDIRLTLASALDVIIERVLLDERYQQVVIDLTKTTGIDSTTLGLLAGLAVRFQKHQQKRPLIIYEDVAIKTILLNMCFDRLFNIIENKIENKIEADVHENTVSYTPLPSVPDDDIESCRRSLKAHKLLMELSDENKVQFQQVVSALEEDLKRNS